MQAMSENIEQEKKKLIEDILRLQDDFEVLTDRSNTLQHQNQYFQTQLEDLQSHLQAERDKVRALSSSNQNQHSPQQQWPIYLKIEGGNLPQQPGQIVKFQGTDGRIYVQYLHLLQYIQTSPDGKSQHVARQSYMVAQQPLESFQLQHGLLQEIKGTEEESHKTQVEKERKENDEELGANRAEK